jgi:KaiC/GvpD/RAD55 family RecA-like ATPase
VPLPPETYVQGLEDLCNFIRIGNRSLLVKGKSGTGKLTLCFELAKSHSEKFDIIFISRNASEHALYNRFPWTKTFIKPTNIISVTNTSDSMLGSDPSFALANIINSIMNLTPKIEDPFLSVKEKTKPFIILEIWDAITKEFDPISSPASLTTIKAEKMLTTLTERNDGFAIFLTEDLQKSSTLEYLVDGVVLLTQDFYGSYRLREMQIEKLKGTHVTRAKVPFSLQGGRFMTFSCLSHRVYLDTTSKTFIPVANKVGFYSTGNTYLDQRLKGGFKRGSVISIDIEEEVDRFVFVPILAPIVLNFISQENAALVIPASDQDVSAVTRYLIPFVEEEKVNQFLKIFGAINSTVIEAYSTLQSSTGSLNKHLPSHSPSPPISTLPYHIYKIGKTFDETYNAWIEEYLMLRKSKKNGINNSVVSVDYSFVELEYQTENTHILKSIIELSRLVRSSHDLLIMVSRSNYKSLEVMKNVSDIHLKVFEYDGATMLAVIKPQLFLCNIQTDYKNGFPSAVLQEST